MALNGAPGEEEEFWLFGYGSLIWKPPPHFDRRIPGWVTGYVRRFWQVFTTSPSLQPLQDHRGTPEAPGRVVTLIERSYWEQLTDHHDASADDRVWGVAYRIVPDRVAEVKDYLDIREINGYTIHYAPFHPAVTAIPTSTTAATTTTTATGPIRTLVYIGTPDNDQFVGPQDPQALAEHIYDSHGPSGLNRDYLWGLERALDNLSPSSGDEHVTDLSVRVRAIDAARRRAAGVGGGGVGGTGVADGSSSLGPEGLDQQQHHHHHEFRKVSSVDEQEETEKPS
ncbi:glutathione-specific gamma-glutamylcyclotransferase [Phialemonium atrogriseum]|uniref:glutathione-specific gamma-glutamylcyclotransferase n=1 Tax=Phialemonium atrogriseum TaxID=1093897 RepID=A0AAJ0FJM7_9PEZI|nr:glutathione-specific gamma-glutamylcyclotransferase [Phialemonium atrogriseum]KAK1764609.1 glutathione-specific gamma-glutamylcyclotransferase [Phialemonium atrogriseum]